MKTARHESRNRTTKEPKLKYNWKKKILEVKQKPQRSASLTEYETQKTEYQVLTVEEMVKEYVKSKKPRHKTCRKRPNLQIEIEKGETQV